MRHILPAFVILLLSSFAAHAEVKRYFAGNPADVTPQLHGPAQHIQGGGADVDTAFQWMFDQVRGCTDCDTRLDVVVLRASGDGDYNDYLLAMKGVDSVETLVITNRADAGLPDVADTIRKAEVVFFSGGDQCDYVSYFKGTPVETAVESVYERGGGIGGTSAGDAIQGEFLYDACGGSTQSSEALANPYHESISFTNDFFHWKYLEGTLTDQHLIERNRIGRTFTFLARQIQDGKTSRILGIAADRETSVLLDKNGMATIAGKGPAYFILADHKPEVCEPNKPLTYSNFKIWKVDAGGTYDLKNRPTTGYYARSVKEGIIDGDPYAPVPCSFDELKAAYAKKDPAAVEQRLKQILRMCPYDLDAYEYVDGASDPEFVQNRATELRRYLNYARGNQLQYYATLWPLELRITPADKQSELRKQIAEDVQEIQSERRDSIADGMRELRKIVPHDGIETMEMAEIGATKQWISIRGRNRVNPVVLVVHGGPGVPLMPAGWAFQAPWEDYFTVVQWDQRGVGKNYEYADHDALAPTLTTERMIQDTEEMVSYLRKRFNKNKIVLMGFSWGTTLASQVAMKHPEWLYAYVGIGAPFNNTTSADEPLLKFAELAPEYYQEEVDGLRDAAKWASAPLNSAKDVPPIALKFHTPVLLMAGRNDADSVKKYFAQIKAAHKKFIVFERSTHFPMLEEPGRFLITLVQEILPLTR